MFKIKQVFQHIVFILLYIVLVIAMRFQPITKTFEMDYDEGFNLIKSLLYSQGFSLYSEIWNDQPPIFTVILSGWFKLFGQSIFAARLLVLLFSSVLILSFYQIVRRELGNIPAIASTFILFTSWLFIRLNISVMIGLPSLSMAMLAIYFLSIYQNFNNSLTQNVGIKDYKKSHYYWLLVFSGILFALSLQIKLFTIFLSPLLILYLLDYQLPKTKNLSELWEYIKPLCIWLISIVIVYLAIGIYFRQIFNHKQVLLTHFNQTQDTNLGIFDNFKALQQMMSQDYDYLFLALIGIWVIWTRKSKNGLLPITWLGTVFLILSIHKPIWYHYYPLLSIPIAWLSAYAIALFVDFVKQDKYRKFNFQKIKLKNLRLVGINQLITTILISGIWGFLMILIIITPPNSHGTVPRNREIIQLVLQHKHNTKWLFTDRPIYAFYAGLKVPPEIAVMSYKRINSGDITTQKLLEILQKYHPEQIVLARWTSQIKADTKIMDYLTANYLQTYSDRKNAEEHYLLK